MEIIESVMWFSVGLLPTLAALGIGSKVREKRVLETLLLTRKRLREEAKVTYA